MALIYNMGDARAQLSHLAERAANGEEIVIARNGRPLARLVALTELAEPLKLRPHREGWAGEDLDYPLPSELESYLHGEPG